MLLQHGLHVRDTQTAEVMEGYEHQLKAAAQRVRSLLALMGGVAKHACIVGGGARGYG